MRFRRMPKPVTADAVTRMGELLGRTMLQATVTHRIEYGERKPIPAPTQGVLIVMGEHGAPLLRYPIYMDRYRVTLGSMPDLQSLVNQGGRGIQIEWNW